MSGKPASTIGHERRFNPFLRADLSTFKSLLDETARAPVANVLLNRNTNRGEVALPVGYGAPGAEIGDAAALHLDRAAALVSDGAVLLDLRDRMAFAAQHPHGALSATYNSSALISRAAALTDADTPLITIADWPFLARYAAGLLSQAGRNPVAGFVDATTNQWQQRGLPTARLLTLSIDVLHDEVERGEALIIDVRAAYEREQGSISGALAIPFADIRAQLGQISRNRPIVVVCESGIRAMGAASLLQSAGFEDVAVVAPEGMSQYLKRWGRKAITS